MENDLFFTLIEPNNWKTFSESGKFKPEYYTDLSYITCYENKEVEQVANKNFEGQNQLLLLVIDPLRIHVPIKKEEIEGIKTLTVHGTFSIDAIIDRIKIERSKKGTFTILIKHFD